MSNDTLANLNSISIEKSLPLKEKSISLIKQLKSPDQFRFNQTAVCFRFDGDVRLVNQIIDYRKNK